jgi:hypothetical protein
MRSLFGNSASRAPVYDFPVLYCISKELVSSSADWPADHIICGHWYHPMTDWQPPHDLLDFIGDERLIYAGFGSPSAFARAKVLKALIDAVAGRRVVFSPGWSNIDRAVLPDNFFIALDVPHEWLFPRVSLAIHHGGLALRTRRRGRDCLRSSCRSEPTSSSGQDVWPRKELREDLRQSGRERGSDRENDRICAAGLDAPEGAGLASGHGTRGWRAESST